MAASAEPTAGAHHATGLHFQLYTLGTVGPVGWRLLSGNNRDMGRGTGEFSGEEECREAVDAMVAAAPTLEPCLVRTTDGRWGWRLSLDGDPVVASGHGSDRRARCELAALRFVELAPLAELRSGVSVLADVRVRGRPDGGAVALG